MHSYIVSICMVCLNSEHESTTCTSSGYKPEHLSQLCLLSPLWVSLSKCFSAVCTFVRLVSKMSEHMLLQIASKCFRTLCAGVGFFSTWFGRGRHRPRTYFSRLPFVAEVQDSESFKDSKSHTRFTSTLSLSDNMKQILPPIGRCWPISHYLASTYLCFRLWWWWWQIHRRPLDDLDILSLAMQAGGWGKPPVPLHASVALIISLQYDQLITQSLITMPLFTTIISMVTINIMCFFDIRDQGKRLRIMITEPLTSSKCGPIFSSAKK